jgi:hypothetical protein
MRHLHLRLLDNGADCDLSQALQWLYLALEDNEPLNTEFVLELQHIAASCDTEYRPDIERLIEKALELTQN